MFEDGSQRKDTFVGTPLYVSPEMLQENVSLPAGDLWALGCIIFRMHTGRTPFAGISESQLFDNILTRTFTIQRDDKLCTVDVQDELDDVTFDLIDRLLKVNPH
jgi:serine/threonine protein kinase